MNGTGRVADLSEAEFRQIKATYFGMISEVDAQIGRVFAALKAAGAWDDTLVIFTSDHAELMGDHYLLGKGGYHDQSQHTPLIIRDPRATRRGNRVEAFTEAVDIYPTILEAIGSTPKHVADGTSLLPWLTEDPATVMPMLGPEPLDEGFTVAQLQARLVRRSGAIKRLLLDQSFIAGVGNIYADEALHIAKIHPLRDASSLSKAEVSRLHTGIRQALSDGILHEGASINWYRKPDGSRGSSQEHLRAYRELGNLEKPCPVCGGPITKIYVNQRGTHFCATCQPVRAGKMATITVRQKKNATARPSSRPTSARVTKSGGRRLKTDRTNQGANQPASPARQKAKPPATKQK
jgi:hypothetical protein